MNLATTPTLLAAALVMVGLHVNQAAPEPIRPSVLKGTKLGSTSKCQMVLYDVAQLQGDSLNIDAGQLRNDTRMTGGWNRLPKGRKARVRSLKTIGHCCWAVCKLKPRRNGKLWKRCQWSLKNKKRGVELIPGAKKLMDGMSFGFRKSTDIKRVKVFPSGCP